MFDDARRIVWWSVIASACCVAGDANAQIPAVDKLLDKVKGVSIWAGPAWLTGSDELEGSSPRDVGLEGSISIATPADWSFDLNVSFESFAGFTAAEASLDLRASIQALPGATLYVSPPVFLGPGEGSRPYVGVNVGRAKLWRAQAFTSAGEKFSVEGETTQFGFAVGVVELNSGFFVELTYRNRDFASLEFTSDDDAIAVPPTWPRSLNANMVGLRFGFQFFREAKEETTCSDTPGSPD
jgi:hypothetical protein